MAQSVLRISAVDNASRVLGKIDIAAKKLNASVTGTGGRLKDAGKGASLLGKASRAATPGIAGMGVAIFAALGPIVAVTSAMAAMSAVVGVIAQQDFAIAKVKSLGVNTAELIPLLGKVSEELDYQFSTLELTKAAYDVASAGFTNAADAAKVLKAAAMGATGGFADLNTTGNAVTSVLNAYGRSADEANIVVDQFIQTQNDGKIVVAQYAQNIGKVAAVAAALKVPLSEINAIIAQSTVVGVKSEVAFTGLKTALLKLTTSEGQKKLEKLGLNINAATIQSEGLAAQFKKMEALDITAIGDIFGTEAIQVMQAVLNDTKKYNELLENQKEALGVAKKAHELATNTMQGQWKRITGAITSAFAEQTGLGKAMTVILQVIGDGVVWIIDYCETWIKLFQQIWDLAKKIGRQIQSWQFDAPGWLKNVTGMGKEFESSEAFLAEMQRRDEEDARITQAAQKLIEKNKEIKTQKTNIDTMIPSIDNMKSAFDRVGEAIGDGLVTGIKEVIKGTQTLGETAANVFNKIADMMLELAIQQAVLGLAGGPTSGFAKFLGFADGGRPPVGKPSIVGERGPEVFVPRTAGTIIPNHQLGGNTSVNVNVDASGSNVQGSEPDAQELGRLIGVAVQSELVRQQRPGGILY